MPATNADIKYFRGTNGAPTNDVDDYGGAIADGGAELNEATPGILIAAVPRPVSSDEDYYGLGYRKNTHASSNWTNAAMTNRAGAKLNSSSGLVQWKSDNPADTGTLRVVAKQGGGWITEDIPCSGIGTDDSFGEENIDSLNGWRYQYTVAGAPAVPLGILTIAVDGEVVAAMYGSSTGFGNGICSAEFEVALATAINATVTGDGGRRLPPSSGIGSFSRACRWTGAGAVNDSIAVPGGSLTFGSRIAYCVHLIAKANIPAPLGNNLLFDGNLYGVGS